MSGGKDHLSHRLISLGCPPSIAVVLLLAVQAGLSALAVLAGRSVVPMGLALACGGALLGAVLLVAARARVYEQAPLTIWTRLRLLVDHEPTRSPPVLQPAVEVESPVSDGGSAR